MYVLYVRYVNVLCMCVLYVSMLLLCMYCYACMYVALCMLGCVCMLCMYVRYECKQSTDACNVRMLWHVCRYVMYVCYVRMYECEYVCYV